MTQKLSSCCNSPCSFEDENCSGEVTVVDEEWTEDDYWWVHACEYHTEKHGY